MPGRALCTEASDEAKKALVQRFLDAASRPKMGKGRAKQSAGQRALDLGKQAKSLEDLDLPQLLALDGAALKASGPRIARSDKDGTPWLS